MDALGFAPVLKKQQSCLGKDSVSCRKRGLLNTLCHRALYAYRDLDRCWRCIGLTLLTPSAAAQTSFRLRCGWTRWFPLRIFDGRDHQPVRLAGQRRLLPVYAERKVVGG